MPCPHNEITIVQRSQRQSAVAAAAYQSGEKLFCEYDQQVKHYPEKRGIVHNEILLPANAPQKYADRNTLCCPSRGTTTPAVAMSSTRWRTAGFLPTTSGAWWRSSMRFSTSAVRKKPSSTLRKALTDFWTLCPEVKQGTGPASETVLALFVSPRDNGEFVYVSPSMREEAVYAKGISWTGSSTSWCGKSLSA